MTAPKLVSTHLLFILLLLMANCRPLFSSEWRTVSLSARPLNIVENAGSFWVCGADQSISLSVDGGKTWTSKHTVKNGGLLLTLGFADKHFGYAAETGGAILITNDGGDTWTPRNAPSSIVYAASFSDPKHGIIQTPHTIYTTADGGATWNPVPIDLSSEDLEGFNYVLGVAAANSSNMAIVLSEGDSSVNAYRLLRTKDGGSKWTASDVPSTILNRLVAHDGEYWFAGAEVIEKDKPGGGYGVPVVMHSSDGEKWTRLPRWSKHEFSQCNLQGCLYWNGAGVLLPQAAPPKFWSFAPGDALTSKWAVAGGSICSVGSELRCAPVAETQTILLISIHLRRLPLRSRLPP